MFSIKKSIALAAVFMIGSIAIAQNKIEFTEFDLPNGLHVILHQDNSTPIVAVTISYHVGSKNENQNRTGFAHFFEHLMFEGSDNIPRGQFDKIAMNAGAQINANTSWDRTFYYILLPSNQLELGLWMESERLLHLRIDSTGVETQRRVVKEERKQSYDNRPYGSLIEKTFSTAYKVHPYRWTPIGSAQYIDEATLEEFIEFHSHYYVPENAILSIAGDIDPIQAKALITKYFADIPRGTKEIIRPNIVEPRQVAEVRDTVYDNIQLPAVVQAYHMPAMGTPDYYALSMLTTLLSDGESSRLNKSIVDKQEKALFVGSFPIPLEEPGLFLVFGIVNMGIDPADLENAVDAEIKLAQTEELSDREFEKLRNKVENDFVSRNSTMAGIAESLSDYKMYFGDANLINTEIQKYLNVTKADIKRVANQYLTKDNRVVLYYLPKKSQ
ncbi:MAG: peptidase M16 [Bacteroidetes bacterium HGW-Bacteroidetes-9]|jgi:predicted Zn-dependent peptidase|nr:MAG: peptidase M16 [Bacteroidetes bacterium HGW-Bacteroidetes-9]